MEAITKLITRCSAVVLLGAMLALAGCYTRSNWEPTVDPYADPRASQINQDLYECRQLALDASGGTGKQALTGGAVGGLLGAAAGAAIGAAAGEPGTGAAIGAASGGLGGGAYKGLTAEQEYKEAYAACMRNRGHSVVN